MIGGGPAGAVAAHRLARAGWRVLLADPLAGAWKPGDALAGAALRLLRACGLPLPSANPAHRPIRGTISLWGGATPVRRDFFAEPDGLGWRLDRAVFEADLIEAARQAGAKIERRRFLATTRRDDLWQVTLTGGSVEARWLVDATGRRAVAARTLGATRLRDERLVALVGRARATGHHSLHSNVIEATPDGWWYAALAPDGAPVFMLHARPGAGRSLAEPNRWRAALAATELVAASFPDAEIDGPLRGFEAGGGHLDRMTGDGWIACGDSAVSFDPCAGQGLLSALYGGMAAADAVDASLKGDESAAGAYAARQMEIRRVYRHRVLSHYAQERRWPETAFWRDAGIA